MFRLSIFSFLSAAAIIFTQPAVSYQYFGSKTSYFVNENTDVRSVNVALLIFASAFDQVMVETPKLIHYLYFQL